MDTILKVRDLRKSFRIGGMFLKRNAVWLRAVDRVSFDVRQNELLSIIGESGCGKTTIARLILRLIKPDEGQITFNGEDVLKASQQQMRKLRRDMQIVFQDTFGSLNPRRSVDETIGFNALVLGCGHKEARQRAWDVMQSVGLDPSHYARRYPHELSGGERQRVNIARALVTHPRLIILDEPVSALDKSIQSQVINLMQDIMKQFGLTLILISHDLSLVAYIGDRTAVMYMGQFVEMGESAKLYDEPLHPYSKALLASEPSLDIGKKETKAPPLSGDPPDPINPPSGCRFRTRCKHAMEICATITPPLTRTDESHSVACFLYQECRNAVLASISSRP